MGTPMLTAKQEEFCRLVAEGNTYADAYRKAYPTSEKWTMNSLYVKSSQMMSDAKIRLRVEELKDEIAKGKQASLEEILEKMSTRVRTDIRGFFNQDGSFKHIHDLSEEQAMCLHKFNVEEIWAGRGDDRTQIGELKRVELIDLRALWDMFLKKYGAYIDRVVVEAEDLSNLKDIVGDMKD